MERARVLVTGGGGFVGRHLIPLLEGAGCEVLSSQVRLPDRPGFAGLIESFRPRTVIHLAGVSFLPDAEADPALAVAVNVDGARSVLEALRDADPAGGTGLVLVSTGGVYRPRGDEPIDEDSPLDPPSVYGRTKLAAELLARTWCEAVRPRPLWVFRPFNHTGPGQRPVFAAPSFARQVALIEAGRAEPVLWTGDLGVRRDFSDVRDVARAYRMAAAGEVPAGTYNLASGRVVSLEWIAERYRSRARATLEVRQRAEPGRSREVKEVRPSAARIAQAAGWRAEIPLERTLDDVLEEWRGRVRAGEAGAAPAGAGGAR